MVSDEDIRALGLEYRGVLVREIRVHRVYSRVAAVTGLGLLGLGLGISFSYSDIGWLLVLVGILRAVSAIYDLGRKDQLQQSLTRLDEKAEGKLGES